MKTNPNMVWSCHLCEKSIYGAGAQEELDKMIQVHMQSHQSMNTTTLRETFGMLIERRKGMNGILVEELIDDLVDYHTGMVKDSLQHIIDMAEKIDVHDFTDRNDIVKYFITKLQERL